MLKTLAVVAALSLAGCATTQNKTNYESYLTTQRQILADENASSQAANLAKISQYGDLRASCSTDACVSQVAAFQSISDIVTALARGNGAGTSTIAAPQREPSLSEKALAWASVLVPGASTIIGITESNKTQRHLSDNSAAIQTSQNAMWSSIIGEQASAWSEAASAPSLVVGGNYGTTNTAGANLVSGDGNTIGTNNFNSGRLNSAGPYDSNDGNCRDGNNNCPVVEPTP